MATAVDGELVVMYDVSREKTAGELQVGQGARAGDWEGDPGRVQLQGEV